MQASSANLNEIRLVGRLKMMYNKSPVILTGIRFREAGYGIRQ